MSRSRIGSVLAWLSSVALTAALVGAIGIAASAPTAGGGPVQQVKITYGGESGWFTGASTWTDVQGASLNMNVPSNEDGLFIARFSGYASCWNDESPFVVPCEIRIRVTTPSGKDSMDPKLGPLDMNGSDPNAFAIDRSFGPVSSGAYSFQVQVRNIGANPTTGVGYWHLTLERVST